MYFACSTTLGWKTELYTYMLVKMVIFSTKFSKNLSTPIKLQICCYFKMYVSLNLFILTFGKFLDSVDLFPVASSTTFFTDMHHLLRIISIGNVRSACHHRLRFLEEVVFFGRICPTIILIHVDDLIIAHHTEVPPASVGQRR